MSYYSRFYEAPYSNIRTAIKPQAVFPQDIQCIHQPTVGNTGGIYISNLQAAQNVRTLGRYGIKAVLTAANGACLRHSKTDVPHYKYVPGEDHESYDLSRYFEECVKWIEEQLNHTNVLVHCMAGISRSATLVIAYLMKCKNMTYDSAFSFVKNRRKIIHPNDGFIRQLRTYEREINSNKASRSPQRATDTRRYQTPQQKRQSTISTDPSSLRQSYIEGYRSPRASGMLTQSKYQSQRTTKDFNYNNQQELDQKIEEIRKKYSEMTKNKANFDSSIQFPLSNASYRRDRYAISFYDNKRVVQRSHLQSASTSRYRNDNPYNKYTGYGQSRLKPQVEIGLPMRKIASLDQQSRHTSIL